MEICLANGSFSIENRIVAAEWPLSMHNIQLLALVLSKIKAKKKSDGQRYISVSVDEFRSVYGIKNNRVYDDLKASAEDLQSKLIKLTEIDDHGKTIITNLSFFKKTRYSAESSGTKIEFWTSSEIAPFLYDLDGNFTEYFLKETKNLKSRFSFLLYKSLKQKQHLKKHKIGGCTIFELKIDDLRRRTDTVDKYNKFTDFNAYCLKPAIDEITAKTDLSVTHRPIKSGRSIESIEFTYVVENDPNLKIVKPLRPRLPRRPKALKGSALEGQWMRKSLTLLSDYKAKLYDYDPTQKMALVDLDRMVSHSEGLGDIQLANTLKNEIVARRNKKKNI